MPATTPIDTEIAVATMATMSDTRAPAMTRARMSRPSVSTPNGWPLDGPVGVPNWSRALEFCTLGPGSPKALASSGPMTKAPRTSKTMNPSAVMATLSRRKRRQNSCSGERAAMSAPTVETSAASGASSRRSVELKPVGVRRP